MNDLVAECLIKDFDQRPFMQVSVLFLYYQLYTVTIAWVMWVMNTEQASAVYEGIPYLRYNRGVWGRQIQLCGEISHTTLKLYILVANWYIVGGKSVHFWLRNLEP